VNCQRQIPGASAATTVNSMPLYIIKGLPIAPA
jgi:hypothetical protein